MHGCVELSENKPQLTDVAASVAMWVCIYTYIFMCSNNLGRILWLWQRVCSSLE